MLVESNAHAITIVELVPCNAILFGILPKRGDAKTLPRALAKTLQGRYR